MYFVYEILCTERSGELKRRWIEQSLEREEESWNLGKMEPERQGERHDLLKVVFL